MYNLIKAQNYQLWRDNYIIYVLIGVVGMTVMNLVASIQSIVNSGELVNGGFFTSMGATAYSLIYMALALAFSARICGWDFTDKTLNYEILAGHTRNEVFWSRAVLSFIWVFAFAVALTVLPYCGVIIAGGWGVNMSFGGALVRFGLAFLMLLRLTCFFIFLTFVVKNCFVSLFLGYILMMLPMVAVMMINEFTKIEITYQLTSYAMISVLDFSNYKLGYVDSGDIVQFITDTDPEFIIGTVVMSLVLSAVYLLLGYTIFRKTDVH